MSTLIKVGLVAATLLATLSPAMAARYERGYGVGDGGWYLHGSLDYRDAPARIYFDHMQRYGN